MNSFDEMRINIGLEKQWKLWNLDGKSMKAGILVLGKTALKIHKFTWRKVTTICYKTIPDITTVLLLWF